MKLYFLSVIALGFFLFSILINQSPDDRPYISPYVSLTIEEKDACESGFLKIKKNSANNCRFWQTRNVVYSEGRKKTIYKLNDPVYAESMELYKYAKSNGFETYNDFVEKTGCTSYTEYQRDTFAPMTWRPFDKKRLRFSGQIGNLFIAKAAGFDSCSAEWQARYEGVKEVKNNNYNLWVVTGMNSPVFSTGVVGNLKFIRTFSNSAACEKLALVYTKITLNRSAANSLGFCLPSNLTESQVRDGLKSDIDLLGS